MDSFMFTCVFGITVLVFKGCATSTTLMGDVNGVFVNSSVTLTCSTSSPASLVLWLRTDKNSQTEARVAGQRWFEENKTCSYENNDMDCTCSSSQIFKCTLQSVTLANDGQRWWCRTVINNKYGDSNFFEFKLMFPITSLSIDPTTQFAYPVFNVPSTFICITSLSRPGANIQWMNDGVNITHLAKYSYNDDVARSSLNYTPSMYNYRGGNLSCVASYRFETYNTVLTANKTFRVQFPVSQPIVTVNNVYTISTAFNIREGRLVHLNCSSTGYPPPSYHWTYPGGESTDALLNITFTRKTGVLHADPPAITRLSNNDSDADIVGNNIRVLRGDTINIQCTSDANPPASVFWQGQQINSSTLTVASIPNDTVWTCQATNFMAEFDGKTFTESATQHLSATVLYGPGVPVITYKIQPQLDASWNMITGPVRVMEGSNIIMMCSVNSKPTSEFSWDHGHKGSIRTIYNITRTISTSYTCTADNVMDTSFKRNVTGRHYSSVNLNLLYGPENISAIYNNVTRIEKVLKVIEGWSFTIVCSASSNPAPRCSWFDPVAKDGSVLIIANASTDMNRNVTCRSENTMVDSVGNNVSATAHATISIEVLYSPNVQRLQNQTAVLNTFLTVLCNLTDAGNPKASIFVWKRRDNGTVVGTNQTLTINKIGLSDEGEYQCSASNTMQPIGNEVVSGFSTSTFYINVEYGAYIRAFKANESHTTTMVNQGESINLVCYADGDPQPLVRILNATGENRSVLVGTEGREAKYRIQQARCEYDTGNYTCVATNRHNEGKQLLTLFIKCSPRASPFSPPIKTLYRAHRDSVFFTFTTIAHPKPTKSDVTWYKWDDGGWKVLSDDTNYALTFSEDNMKTQLIIFTVQLGDFTSYMVNVSNILGSTMELFTLQALSKPIVPSELQVIKPGKTELALEWIPGFNGGEKQTFTIRYKELDKEAGSLSLYQIHCKPTPIT